MCVNCQPQLGCHTDRIHLRKSNTAHSTVVIEIMITRKNVLLHPVILPVLLLYYCIIKCAQCNHVPLAIS